MKNKNKQTKPTTKTKPQQQPKKKIENHACSCGPPAQGGPRAHLQCRSWGKEINKHLCLVYVPVWEVTSSNWPMLFLVCLLPFAINIFLKALFIAPRSTSQLQLQFSEQHLCSPPMSPDLASNGHTFPFFALVSEEYPCSVTGSVRTRARRLRIIWVFLRLFPGSSSYTTIN